jgi:hypothetical protein
VKKKQIAGEMDLTGYSAKRQLHIILSELATFFLCWKFSSNWGRPFVLWEIAPVYRLLGSPSLTLYTADSDSLFQWLVLVFGFDLASIHELPRETIRKGASGAAFQAAGMQSSTSS